MQKRLILSSFIILFIIPILSASCTKKNESGDPRDRYETANGCLIGTEGCECALEQQCGSEQERCCAADTICMLDRCVPTTKACEFTEQCSEDEFCESIIGFCLPRDLAKECTFVPQFTTLEPQTGSRWTPPDDDEFAGYRGVVMTPTVANLTDDNGDGVTDVKDIPDIVFIAFGPDRDRPAWTSNDGVLRIINGDYKKGNIHATINFGDETPSRDEGFDVSGGIAIGNLHRYVEPGDSTDSSSNVPEIIATTRIVDPSDRNADNLPRILGNGIVAFTRDPNDSSQWSVLWHNDTAIVRGKHTAGGPNAATLYAGLGAIQPSLADLDGDGLAEVIVGNVVLNGLDGSVKWDGFEVNNKDVGEVGAGNNALLGPVSVVADIDLDGKPEVIAGNTAYDDQGREKWTYTLTFPNNDKRYRCSQAGVPCDGYPAVGNLDDDDEGEVVIIAAGRAFVLEHDGTQKHIIDIPWLDVNCGNNPSSLNESGPPTIADFDGDGRAEFATAGAYYYVVFDLDCQGNPLPQECDSQFIRWKVRNLDCSSRSTGSSVFDFEGDGQAEVIYADQENFRIFRGSEREIFGAG